MADRITIDISILQGIFGDLTKLQQQLSGVTGGVSAVDNAAAKAFGSMRSSVGGASAAVNALDNSVDVSMRNIVSDIMAPVAKAQELETKLRNLGDQVRTSKSVKEIVALKREITATQRELDGVNPSPMENRVSGSVGRMRSMFGSLVAPLAGVFAVGAVTQFGRSVVDAAAKSQSFDTSMRVMLQSKEKADELSAQVTSFAGSTPFELGQLRNATTQLLAYQVSADQIIPTLESLGNIAAGVGMDKLPQLMTAFGQVKAAGKLTGGELKQFTEAGVPLLDELAKITGKSTASMAGNIAKLEIPFETVQQALTNMSSGNGKFANLMKEQSATIGGQLSNLTDVWDKFKEDIGVQLAPQIMSGIELLKGGIDKLRTAFAWLQDNWESIASTGMAIFKGLAFVMGIYTIQLVANNSAYIINNALQAVAAVRLQAMAMWTALTTGTVGAATAAQWSWNAALLANPIGLVVAGIAALVAGVVYAWNNFEGFRMTLYGVWEAAKVVFFSILEVVKATFGWIVDGAKGVAGVLEGIFTGNWSQVKAGMADFAKAVGNGLIMPVNAAKAVVDQASGLGEKVGAAYSQGRIAGLVAFNADKQEAAKEEAAKRQARTDASDVKAPGQDVGASELVGGASKSSAKGKDEGVTVGGSSGSGRTITMDIQITNNITMPKDGNMGVRELADKISAALTNKLNDAQYAMG